MYYDVVGRLTEEDVADPQVHELAKKIAMVEDPELTKRYERNMRGGEA